MERRVHPRPQVVTLALKSGIGCHRHDQEEVAGWATRPPRAALTRETDPRAVCHPCGNPHLDATGLPIRMLDGKDSGAASIGFFQRNFDRLLDFHPARWARCLPSAASVAPED